MSRTSLLIGIVVVLIVALGAGYWFFSASKQGPAGMRTEDGAPQMGGAAVQMAPGTSDADLEQNLNAIDTAAGSFSSDNTKIDQSMSDQQVQQASL